MDQEPTHDLAIYLGLQGFEVGSVAFEQDRRGKPIKVLEVQRSGGSHRCPECGKTHRDGLFDEFEPIRFRDCSLGDRETYVQVRAMRVACCGGTRVEQLPFAMPGFRMTRRFFERIAALCTRLPIQAVAQMGGLSWDTVAQVDERAIELALGEIDPSLLRLRWIGVDEVSRTGGHVYFTIVTDLEKGQVVWIGDGKGEQGLLPFLEALGAPEGVVGSVVLSVIWATHGSSRPTCRRRRRSSIGSTSCGGMLGLENFFWLRFGVLVRTRSVLDDRADRLSGLDRCGVHVLPRGRVRSTQGGL